MNTRKTGPTVNFRPDRTEWHHNALLDARQRRLAGPLSADDYAHVRGIFNPYERAVKLAAMRRAEREAEGTWTRCYDESGTARCRCDRCGDAGCDREHERFIIVTGDDVRVSCDRCGMTLHAEFRRTVATKTKHAARGR